jgi:hypothetical protein
METVKTEKVEAFLGTHKVGQIKQCAYTQSRDLKTDEVLIAGNFTWEDQQAAIEKILELAPKPDKQWYPDQIPMLTICIHYYDHDTQTKLHGVEILHNGKGTPENEEELFQFLASSIEKG